MLPSRHFGQVPFPLRSYFVRHTELSTNAPWSLPLRCPSLTEDLGLCGDRGLAEIRQEGGGGVAAVEGDDRTRGVGRGSAHVETRDRGSGREAALPHLVGGHLALEDVAAGKADAALDVGWAEDFGLLQAVGEVGGEAGDQVDELLLDVLAAAVPIAVLDVVGRVLADDGEQGLVRRGWRGGVDGLDVDLAEADRGLSPGAGLEGLLRSLEAGSEVDRRLGRPGLPRRRG